MIATAPRTVAGPALACGVRRAAWLDASGELLTLSLDEAVARLNAAEAPPLVCHARGVARRLGVKPFAARDLLELYAFVEPATFCLPTPRGLAAALGLDPPAALEDEAFALAEAAQALLDRLAAPEPKQDAAVAIAAVMARAGWLWGPAVQAALAAGGHLPSAKAAAQGGAIEALAVWSRLKEWQEFAPEPAADHHGVAPTEARQRLARLVGDTAEDRPQQSDYASAVSAAFSPRDAAGEPHVVLAEAGTGVGKTLGYLAPASLWAERNDGTVWLSTYTRNLQRQVDQELDKLFPDPKQKTDAVVVRKGRENYLCLLNYDEAVHRSALLPADRVALGLIARWILASRDGDVQGGDLPAWLIDLLGPRRTLGLTDRRGECIYAACTHYRTCFIEKTQRRARTAEIVIANHALVMVQAARDAYAGEGDRRLPTRFVFDEAHHVFDAADGAFSGHLSGQETYELRRWLLGPERAREAGGPSVRGRGLKSRIGDLIADRRGALASLDEVLKAARALPGEGWHERIEAGAPQGPTERFLALVRKQVMARATDPESPYGLEAPVWPLDAALPDAAAALEAALLGLARPIRALIAQLDGLLDDEAAHLEREVRVRIEAVVRGLGRRLEESIEGWRAMLGSLGAETGEGDEQPAGAPEGFVDWFAIDRFNRRERDIGMRRHHLDPTVPFTALVLARAHGVVMTSATLRDGSGDAEADWAAAEARTGARHLIRPAIRAEVPSPFDYARQTRVFVVTDVPRREVDKVAAAYRELFLAAGGGALGLFTAIERLRAVHARIAPALEAHDIPLWAQHVDALDTATLVDIFRAEEESCLLGTDAIRDGVDVPGRSLRLIVFDRVPWPRPDILHKARRAAFGGRAYDDLMTRLRLKQAYGRLIRRASDLGVFVLLDAAFPSRLHAAFPPGVAVERVGLSEAVAATHAFVAPVPALSPLQPSA
ncbi:MAG: ATP-dependent DNA helicase [Alphaproteobacteria bacterium]